MIVYKDVLSGDEVLSDAFSLKEVLDKDGNTVSRPHIVIIISFF